MGTWKINNLDVLEWCKSYKGEPFHSMLCDAPYELNFMSKKWDGTGIAFNPETWYALGRHLYDGAFIMAYAGTRGYHRMAVAIEDAGFIIHPVITWIQGCLSDDTEILTEHGWMEYTQLLTGYRAMCYNVENGTLDYMPIEEVYVYDYDDTAYRIQSDNTDQLVTRNHRCLVERGGEYVFRYAETLERQEVVPILESVSEVPESILRRECGRVSQKDDMRLGYLQEGNGGTPTQEDVRAGSHSGQMRGLREKDNNTERMAKESKAPDLLKKLQREIKNKGACATFRQGSGGMDKRESSLIQREDEWRKQSCVEGWSNLLSQAWQLCVSQVRSLSERVLGDVSQGRICYGTSSASGASDWQMPKTLRGSSSRQSQPARQQARESDAILKQYSTQELRTSWISTPDLAIITPEHYTGIVWCVKVPTGAFVARRNGKVFVTGNSGFPKATRVKDNKDFEGHRYGLQALKPSCEMICVAQKPYSGKPVSNITKTGAGALWIDGARIGTTRNVPASHSANNGSIGAVGRINRLDEELNPNLGRWPANVVLQHTPECRKNGTKKVKGDKRGSTGGKVERGLDGKDEDIYVAGWRARTDIAGSAYGDLDGMEEVAQWECVEGCPVLEMDRQSGTRQSDSAGKTTKTRGLSEIFNGLAVGQESPFYTDSGGASRFFLNADWSYEIAERLDETAPFMYTPKASRGERDAGLDEFKEIETYSESAMTPMRDQREQSVKRNGHPTIKPISLNKWLATLLLPPYRYAPRRILNPFSGVASEAIGALLTGWEEVVMIESDTEYGYCDIAETRLQYWIPKIIVPDNSVPRQISMF